MKKMVFNLCLAMFVLLAVNYSVPVFAQEYTVDQTNSESTVITGSTSESDTQPEATDYTVPETGTENDEQGDYDSSEPDSSSESSQEEYTESDDDDSQESGYDESGSDNSSQEYSSETEEVITDESGTPESY